MLRAAALEAEAGDFVEELTESLREKSARIAPSRLVSLTGMAIQKAFRGTSREEKLAQAMARGLSVREKMATAEGGSMSAEEAARYLGVTKQSVLNSYHAGKLLGWKTERQGAIRFPAWQFAEGQRLVGLGEVLAKLNEGKGVDDWARLGFFLQGHGVLNGKRPLDLLRQKKLNRVLQAAEAYVA